MNAWRKVGCCLVAAVAALGARAEVYYVNAGVSGGSGDGSSWENAAATLPASIPSGVTEIWVATNELRGASYGYTGTLTIRGGFVGTENEPAERVTGLRTVINGHDEDANCLNFTAACALTLESMSLTHAGERALVFGANLGSRALAIRDCDFVDNGLMWDSQRDSAGGRAILVSNGGGWCSFLIQGCKFVGNRKEIADSDGNHNAGGAAVYVNNTGLNTLRDCTFTGNGVALDKPLGADATVKGAKYGAALYVGSGNLDMERCAFVGNRVMMKSSAYGAESCVVALELGGGDKSTCRIAHCLFLGNEGVAVAKGDVTPRVAGALGIYSNGNNVPVNVEACTFAYNCFDTSSFAGGLSSCAGTVNITNCIFYGNRTMRSTGRDIWCAKGAINVDYTLVTESDQVNGVTCGNHMQYGDPMFKTTMADFEALLTNVVDSSTLLPAFIPDAETTAKVLAFDAHVDSDVSPAIDTGDDSPYENEPDPNGGRVNLGYYGNTKEAHTTPKVQPELVPGSLTVEFPYGTSQARISFTVAGEGEYRADATVLWTTNGTDWVEFARQTMMNGDSFCRDAMFAFDQGSVISLKVTLVAAGADTRIDEISNVSVDYPKPIYSGRGGGANVLHVRPGATGDGTGSDWFNAVAALPEKVPSGKTEIWVATNELRGASYGYTGTLPIRGGFVGTETVPEERVKGLRTVINGQDEDANCICMTAACNLTLDSLELTHAAQRALYFTQKLGGITLATLNCSFTDNGLGWQSHRMNDGGRAIWLGSSGASGTFIISNCVFSGNCKTNADTSADYNAGHGAVYIGDSKLVQLRDCLFVGNGVPIDAPLGGDSPVKGGQASALEVTLSGLDMERCVFIGNRTQLKNSAYGAFNGTVYATVGSLSTAFRIAHCLFIGNEGVAATTGDANTKSAGTLIVDGVKKSSVTMEIEGCTFAYNVFETGGHSAGLKVDDGTARVRNCIFYGNRAQTATTAGSDVRLANGTLDIDYSLLSTTDELNPKNNRSITAATANNLTLGEHMQYGDPKFVTKLADFEACLTDVVISGTHLPAFIPDAETVAKVLAFDAHVRRSRSPAVDTGDPASEWANEPKPNGGRVNMGAYGNTSEAMTSPGGSVIFVK